MDRRRFLSLCTRAATAVPFAALLPRWYGTAQQWALHAKEGVLRLAQQGRLVEVPPSALANGPPSSFVKFSNTASNQWLGYWSGGHGKIFAWVDRTGRAWWAKP